MMAGSNEAVAREAAQDFRDKHGLGTQPLGDLVALIEQTTGHDVAVLDAESDEHGLTMTDPLRGRVFIGVARTRNPMRQRSTLAHELAHLIFQDQAEDLSKRSSVEVRADAFARHVLVPTAGVRDILGETWEVTERHLSDIVQRYLVSPSIAAIAMRDSQYINPETAKQWMSISTPQLASRFGWSDYYAILQGDSNKLRAPQGLLARAIAGYTAGVVSLQTIATLRGLPVEDIATEFSENGIVVDPSNDGELDLVEFPDVDLDLSDLGDEENDS